MTTPQTLIFLLLAALLVLLIWGRWRYDLVSALILVLAVAFGLIPPGDAFAGFGHPATVTVAMMLIISRAMSQAGAMDGLVKMLERRSKTPSAQIAGLTSMAGAMSAFMNNVGALGLLMPAALKLAQNAKRSTSIYLMPLSFATLLGGLVTLVGTPPNIIIATIRRDLVGEPFHMFDFTPVGLTVALVGIAFIALVGWRFVPQRKTTSAPDELFDIDSYISEVLVPASSPAAGKRLSDIEEMTQGIDALVVGLVRDDQRYIAMPKRQRLRAGDTLVIEANPENLDALMAALALKVGEAPDPSKSAPSKSAQAKDDKDKRRSFLFRPDRSELAEAVVAPDSRLIGRTVSSLGLPGQFGVNLLGVSRQGTPYRGRLATFRFRTGDIVLLHGEADRLPNAVQDLGCMPLAGGDSSFGRRDDAWMLIAVFAAAIGVATLGLVSLPIALLAALTIMIGTNLLPLREVYQSVDWSVIVLLGTLIPVGGALETTGANGVIADFILSVTAGNGPVVVLVLVMVFTMMLTDVLNNAATAVVMAPIGVTLAHGLGVNPDAFLMTVAIGSSSAFLTPIGHQNNALILGPGGYHFNDYWRLGLPLEILIVLVTIPMILWVWPLYG